MDLSRGFITKLVDEGGLQLATRSGIEGDFLDNEAKSVYKYIGRHFTQFKQVPSRDAILKAFPNFEFTEYDEPLDYFIEGLKDAYRITILDQKLGELADVYTREPSTAIELLRATLAELQITQRTFRDLDLAGTAEERFARYLDRKEAPGADGILSEWPTLDYQTLGWHPEEFIVLVGEKYMGKSWLMIWLAYQAMLQNEKVLFVTREMSQEQVIRRLDSIYANVKFDSLRRGELSQVEEDRYKERMQELKSSSHQFVTAREGVNFVEDIETKAVEIDATIIFTDSVYLFSSRNSKSQKEVERRGDISRLCKRIATNLGVPLIVSVQAGRVKSRASKEPDLDNIEWSNAFSQDADTVFYLHKDDLDKELRRAQIWLLKSRDGDVAQFYIDQDFEYMTFKERDDTREPTTDIEFDEDVPSIFDAE